MKKETAKKIDNGMSGIKKGMLVGAGLAALAATVAGTYFMYGAKGAAKNRKKIKSWILKAKGEVLEKMEELQDVNEEIYHKIVAEVADKYKTLKNLDSSDIEEFTGELKDHWQKIQKEISKQASKQIKKLK